MGDDSALLQFVLRLPVRDVVHGVVGLVGESSRGRTRSHRALSDLSFGGEIEISDRLAEGRRCRYDQRRTPGVDRQEDESCDGRDGKVAEEERYSSRAN